MIRVVDMEEATSSKGSFALWNTVTSSFIVDDYGDQSWDSLKQIEGVQFTEGKVRILRLVSSFTERKT